MDKLNRSEDALLIESQAWVSAVIMIIGMFQHLLLQEQMHNWLYSEMQFKVLGNPWSSCDL